ncbi:MAG TPA: hypothetical protein VK435_09645 [Thermodesulfovibrionales bacterium]|nr:hypothetical protein [Thermodesulfovibrionales bacterium]
MRENKRVMITKRLAGAGKRVVASPKPEKILDKEHDDFRERQSVDLLICELTEIGYKAIINGSREGLLYRNEVFQTLRKGQKVTGFIKKIREDGKIDLCLQKPGVEKVDDVSGRIIERLKAQGGSIALDDKTPPEVIYRLFGVSKKTFKKAIGALYRKRVIQIERSGISLVKSNGPK